MISTALKTFVLIILFCGFDCYTSDDVKRFLEDKTPNYNKGIRPIVNQSATMYVDIAFNLVAIQEFDEVKQTMSLTGFFVASWNDEFMQWDPVQYGGMTYVTLETEQFWKPNIVLGNSAGKIEKLTENWNVINFIYNGTTNFLFADAFSVACNVDITYYPWDKQTCGLYVSVLPYATLEIFLVNTNKKLLSTYFTENGAWTFVDSDVKYLDETKTTLNFSITIERKPLFLAINVILPIVFMSFLNAIVFFIPAESGERISYNITVFLSIAVFLTLVSDNLPKTSDPMALFSFYILSILVISICIIFATNWSLHIYFRDGICLKPTGFTRRVVRYLNRKERRKELSQQKKDKVERRNREMKKYSQDGGSHILEDSLASVYMPDIYPYNTRKDNHFGKVHKELKFGGHFKPVTEDNNRPNGVLSDNDSNENLTGQAGEVTWKDVSRVLDQIFFKVFMFLTIVVTGLFFLFIILRK